MIQIIYPYCTGLYKFVAYRILHFVYFCEAQRRIFMLLLIALFKISHPQNQLNIIKHVKDKSYIGSAGIESKNVYDFEA